MVDAFQKFWFAEARSAHNQLKGDFRKVSLSCHPRPSFNFAISQQCKASKVLTPARKVQICKQIFET